MLADVLLTDSYSLTTACSVRLMIAADYINSMMHGIKHRDPTHCAVDQLGSLIL